MRHRGDILITIEDFIKILEYYNLPSLKREIELYKKNTSPTKILPFMMWVCSLNQGAREELMMAGLSKENWERFHNWDEGHISNYDYCKMLFPFCERAEQFYEEASDCVIKEN